MGMAVHNNASGFSGGEGDWGGEQRDSGCLCYLGGEWGEQRGPGAPMPGYFRKGLGARGSREAKRPSLKSDVARTLRFIP